MSKWGTGEAKQRFSEVLRRSAEEPQLIYSRDRLVAVVVSAADYAELERARESRQRQTLAERFAEVRDICARYDYELDTGVRADRPGWEEEGP